VKTAPGCWARRGRLLAPTEQGNYRQAAPPPRYDVLPPAGVEQRGLNAIFIMAGPGKPFRGALLCALSFFTRSGAASHTPTKMAQAGKLRKRSMAKVVDRY
jgi:hypothetical protein